MVSGTFTGTTGNKHITARIIWTSTPNTSTNRSIVTATLAYKKSSSSTSGTWGTGTFTITIGGAPTTFNVDVNLPANDVWVTVGSASVSLLHETDGSRSVTISATGGIPGLTFSSTNCSATVILDRIPRATAPTFGASVQTIGSKMKINLNAADADFYHTVTYSWGPLSGLIGEKLTISKEWDIPIDFCEGVPNGTQGTLFITVETFTSNGVSLGKVTRSTPCNVPESVVPSIKSIAVTDTGGNVPSDWELFVRGKSVLHVYVDAEGVYSSRIVGYSIRALGVTVASNDVDVGIVSDAGSMKVEVTVTDSRGRTASDEAEITVVDYAEPVIEAFSVERANDSGTPVDNGTFAKIPLKASASSVNGKNSVEAKIYHMRSDLDDWTLARTIPVEYAIDQTVMIANMITSRSYAIKVEVSDTFGSTAAEGVLNAEGAVMGWMPGGIGISFGKAAEEDYSLDSAWKIHGRKGAQFDDHVDVTGNVNASGAVNAKEYQIGGNIMLRLADVLAVSRDGTNVQLGTTSSYVKVDFTNFIYSLRGLLSLSSGGILIPAGIQAVRVSAQVCLGAATAGARYVQVSKNNFNTTLARSQRQHVSTSVPETHVISGALTPVSEGDIIMVGVYGNTADWVYGNYNQTYLTVEAYA